MTASFVLGIIEFTMNITSAMSIQPEIIRTGDIIHYLGYVLGMGLAIEWRRHIVTSSPYPEWSRIMVATKDKKSQFNVLHQCPGGLVINWTCELWKFVIWCLRFFKRLSFILHCKDLVWKIPRQYTYFVVLIHIILTYFESFHITIITYIYIFIFSASYVLCDYAHMPWQHTLWMLYNVQASFIFAQHMVMKKK